MEACRESQGRMTRSSVATGPLRSVNVGQAWKEQKKHDERFFVLRSQYRWSGCLGMPRVFWVCSFSSGLLALHCMPFGTSGPMKHLGQRTRMSGLIEWVISIHPKAWRFSGAHAGLLKLTDARSDIGCRAKLVRGLQRGCVGPHGFIATVNG